MGQLDKSDIEICNAKIALQKTHNDLPPHIKAKYPLTTQEKITTPAAETPANKNIVESYNARKRFHAAIQTMYETFGIDSYEDFKNVPHLSAQDKDNIEAGFKRLFDKAETAEASAEKDLIKMLKQAKARATLAATIDKPSDSPAPSSSSSSSKK